MALPEMAGDMEHPAMLLGMEEAMTTNARNNQESIADILPCNEAGTELLIDFTDRISLFIMRDGDEVITALQLTDEMEGSLDSHILSIWGPRTDTPDISAVEAFETEPDNFFLN